MLPISFLELKKHVYKPSSNYIAVGFNLLERPSFGLAIFPKAKIAQKIGDIERTEFAANQNRRLRQLTPLEHFIFGNWESREGMRSSYSTKTIENLLLSEIQPGQHLPVSKEMAHSPYFQFVRHGRPFEITPEIEANSQIKNPILKKAPIAWACVKVMSLLKIQRGFPKYTPPPPPPLNGTDWILDFDEIFRAHHQFDSKLEDQLVIRNDEVFSDTAHSLLVHVLSSGLKAPAVNRLDLPPILSITKVGNPEVFSSEVNHKVIQIVQHVEEMILNDTHTLYNRNVRLAELAQKWIAELVDIVATNIERTENSHFLYNTVFTHAGFKRYLSLLDNIIKALNEFPGDERSLYRGIPSFSPKTDPLLKMGYWAGVDDAHPLRFSDNTETPMVAYRVSEMIFEKIVPLVYREFVFEDKTAESNQAERLGLAIWESELREPLIRSTLLSYVLDQALSNQQLTVMHILDLKSQAVSAWEQIKDSKVGEFPSKEAALDQVIVQEDMKRLKNILKIFSENQ